MQLHEYDCDRGSQSHRREQNVQLQVAGDKKAGNARHQETNSENEKRTASADSTDEESGAGADRDD